MIAAYVVSNIDNVVVRALCTIPFIRFDSFLE